MAGPERPEASRIAIKLGTPSSNSRKGSGRAPPSSTLGKRQRPSHGLGGSSDSDEAEDSHTNGRHERITAFGENGAELAKGDRGRRRDDDRSKRKPLIIERQGNRDWRSEARARNQREHRQSAPARKLPGGEKEDDVMEAKQPMQWGLTITNNVSTTDEDDNQNRSSHKTASGREDTPEVPQTRDTPENSDTTVENEAVKVLLGQTIDDRTKTKRVIERTMNTVTEDDVFERDFNDAPDVSTLEEYEEMPVEEFGAALLRGMGWDGKDKGAKIKQVVRRPNQMGLGAKELKGLEDLGGWNHKSGSSSTHKQRPPKLHEYRREEEKRRVKRDDRYRDSYKGERDRERGRDHGDSRNGDHHRGGDSSNSGQYSRHRR